MRRNNVKNHKSANYARIVKPIIEKKAQMHTRICAAALASLFFCPLISFAMPQDPTVAAGNALISQNHNKMTVHQGSERAVINWGGYSINVNEVVEYIQPNSGSIILNRVTGGDPSRILGQLKANGQVFIVNPNGILFGDRCRVNVAGLLATTHAVNDSGFMADKHEFCREADQELAAVINQGEIRIADNGYAVLVAPLGANEGMIIANMGKVRIGTAERFSLNFDGGQLVNFTVNKVPQGHDTKAGAVLVPASQIAEMVRQVVNRNGNSEAQQMTAADGRIRLTSVRGTAINSGRIAVDGQGRQAAGSVEIRADNATLITGGSKISADGSSTGSNAGHIRLLADMQNGRSVLEKNASVSARSVGFGNGGFVELSGSRFLWGSNVDVAAENGRTGRFLLDPVNITVSDQPDSDGNVSTATLANQLKSGNVTISALGAGDADGNITLSNTIDVTGITNPQTTLTLSAYGNLVLNAIAFSRTDSGMMNLVLGAGNVLSINNDIDLFSTGFLGIGCNADGGSLSAAWGYGDGDNGSLKTPLEVRIASGVEINTKKLAAVCKNLFKNDGTIMFPGAESNFYLGSKNENAIINVGNSTFTGFGTGMVSAGAANTTFTGRLIGEDLYVYDTRFVDINVDINNDLVFDNSFVNWTPSGNVNGEYGADGSVIPGTIIVNDPGQGGDDNGGDDNGSGDNGSDSGTGYIITDGRYEDGYETSDQDTLTVPPSIIPGANPETTEDTRTREQIEAEKRVRERLFDIQQLMKHRLIDYFGASLKDRLAGIQKIAWLISRESAGIENMDNENLERLGGAAEKAKEIAAAAVKDAAVKVLSNLEKVKKAAENIADPKKRALVEKFLDKVEKGVEKADEIDGRVGQMQDLIGGDMGTFDAVKEIAGEIPGLGDIIGPLEHVAELTRLSVTMAE
jgi:filamentous hemagglutinin family protein